MKYLYLVLFFVSAGLFAQNQDHKKYSQQLILNSKLKIDSNAFRIWPSIGKAYISNDGNCFIYFLENVPVGGETLVIHNLSKNWKLNFINVIDPVITQNSRHVIFRAKDSLFIVQLNSATVQCITEVKSFRLANKGNSDWVTYMTSDSNNKVISFNLTSHEKKVFTGVSNYYLSGDGNILLTLKKNDHDSVNLFDLEWINLVDGERRLVWSGLQAENFVFDNEYKKVVFIGRKLVNKNRLKSIWYYNSRSDKLIPLVHDSIDFNRNLSIGFIRGFGKENNRIFIYLNEKESPNFKLNENTKLDIWSYRDSRLQSSQIRNTGPKIYNAMINLENPKIIQLEYENEWSHKLQTVPLDENIDANSSYIVFHTEGDVDNLAEEWHWNSAWKIAIYSVSLIDGSRREIKGINYSQPFGLRTSLFGKFLVYYDSYNKNFFTYEINSGKIRNITKNIKTTWAPRYGDTYPSASDNANLPCAWFPNDSALLLYDQNDIWQIDPLDIRIPINITNGYGKKHDIVFRLALDYTHNTINENRNLILNAFNRHTKENGFFSAYPSKSNNPELLTMGPYLYHYPNPPANFGIADINEGNPPVKASGSEKYILTRMSSSEAPNYYVTSDFKSLIKLSDLNPEKNYNWYTTELLNWKDFDGVTLQGVLFKPEDFDPQKKYPVIFYYYRTLSDGLNQYIKPQPCDGRLIVSIPYFVSNGYLVFTPDIHYKLGETGASALNSVTSAMRYLSSKPYIDVKKVGIQGHSFGGFETNYIVTHTNIFAAACSSSGLYDLVSGYGSLSAYNSKQAQFEVGPYQLGSTLWQRPDLFIKNSPIFNAHAVNTPFLMMATPADNSVPFAQAVEFFTALRRLGKKSWLLQYDDIYDFHTINGRSAFDFTIRLKQFFDHYLMDIPPPKWMTTGVPAKLKGVEPGFEIDAKFKTPGVGLNILK